MIVRLDSVKRENGNTADDISRVGKEYRVYSAMVGAGGVFAFEEDRDKALFTSRVEQVSICHGLLTVKTRNTEYHFEIL